MTKPQLVCASTTQASLVRDEILGVLRTNQSLLREFGISRLSLFGSFARNEAGEEGDVDLLVEFKRPIGLFEFARLQRELGERLGRRVELVTPAALKSQLRATILAEAVLVSEGVPDPY